MKHNPAAQEKQTVEAMIRLYCKKQHNSNLCDECSRLLAYTHQRIERCGFGHEKPTCNRCPIHCYSATNRTLIKRVMRYAGPRMFLYHPVMALKHLYKQTTKRKKK